MLTPMQAVTATLACFVVGILAIAYSMVAVAWPTPRHAKRHATRQPQYNPQPVATQPAQRGYTFTAHFAGQPPATLYNLTWAMALQLQQSAARNPHVTYYRIS